MIPGFSNPQHTFRPAPFWAWNAELDNAELIRQIRLMKKAGWGGFFMHSRVGLITPYLSKEWFDCVKTSVREAGRMVMDAWIYDEDKWPSGFAGGLVPETGPEHRMKALRALDPRAFDPATDKILKTCRIRGEEKLICQFTAPLGYSWFNGASYADLLNPETVKRFLDVTLPPYKKTVESHFGRAIPGVFTDEPSYCYYHFAPPFLLPWTPGLPAFFRKLKGYSLQNHLEKLFFAVGDSRRIRHDFFEALTRLFVKSFTEQYHRVCRKNKLIFTGHVMREDCLLDQVKWVGAAMPHYEHMDWPGVDKLGRNTRQTVTIKQMTSVSEQLGKARSFCEVYGCAGQQFDFRARRWIHNWQAALGINYVNHHLSLYSMAGERKRDCPPNLFYQQPWWPYEKRLSDYIGRLNFMLTRGKRQVDVLVLHPIASIRALYNPVIHSAVSSPPPVTGLDALFKELTDGLLSRQIDFHYGDEMILEKHGRVNKHGKLAVGQHAYSRVVIPPSLTWSSKTLSLLRCFRDKGGFILFAGQVPEFSDMSEKLNFRAQFPTSSFTHSVDHAVSYLAVLIKDRANAESPYIFTHERLLPDKRKLVFFTNTSETKTIKTKINIPYSGRTERLFCDTGRTIPFTLASTHEFPPGGYLLLSIDPGKKPLKHPPKNKPIKKMKVDGWSVRPLNPNVLPVDVIDLELDHKPVLKNAPISQAWDDHFYKAADGTPFRAVYRWKMRGIPKGRISIAVEKAENLESVTINGKPPCFLKGHWLDPAFHLLDITNCVKIGENRLVITGTKRNNITGPNCHRRVKSEELPFKYTELEAVYILGDFHVLGNVIVPFKKTSSFSDLTRNGYPYYAGLFSATTRVVLQDISKNVRLRFKGVAAPCLDIRINGKKAGVLLWEPYELEISRFLKKGRNEIEVLFPTDLFNLMGPHKASGDLPEFTGPADFRGQEKLPLKLGLLRKGLKLVMLYY